MNRLTALFLANTLIGPLHMGEQLLTSLEEFYAIRPLVGRYYTLFPAAAADHATVLLITILWTLVSLMLLALLMGGRPRLTVLGIFGVFGVTEIHHLIEAMVTRSYDPGVITCIPYAIAGAMLAAAVWRELRGGAPEPVREQLLA